MRKYPPVGTLLRKAAKDYAVPGTDHILPKGSQILIPAYAIQHDSNYYSDPERFDPDRFAPEQKSERNIVTFLPFGQGPRNCIGLRFGMMQTRIGLVSLLCNYEIGRCVKTQLKISKKSFLLNTEGGMWLKLRKITAKK